MISYNISILFHMVLKDMGNLIVFSLSTPTTGVSCWATHRPPECMVIFAVVIVCCACRPSSLGAFHRFYTPIDLDSCAICSDSGRLCRLLESVINVTQGTCVACITQKGAWSTDVSGDRFYFIMKCVLPLWNLYSQPSPQE